MDFRDMAYGTREHRREPTHYNRDRDDMRELGEMAVKGVVTVGVVGVTAGLMGGIIGGMQK